MALAKVSKRPRHIGKNFDGVIRNRMRETVNRGVHFRGNRIGRQTLETRHQRMREAVQPVSVGNNVFPFDLVQNLANLFRRILVMIEKRDETRDGALEIDVVLPERVIRIDE